MEPTALIEIAARQHGCFNRAQALTVISVERLERLHSRGHVRRAHPATYVMTGWPESWIQRAMAAVLSVPGSALSHKSAARLWGLTKSATGEIHITVPRNGATIREGVVLHRTKELEGYTTTNNDIPVTTVARTIIDLSARTSFYMLGKTLDQALRLKLVTLAEVHLVLKCMTTVGRSKISKVRTLLDNRTTDDELLESTWEDEVAEWIDRSTVPRPLRQLRVVARNTPYRFDFAYPDVMLCVEADGPQHLLPSVARQDHQRDLDVATLGWYTLRIIVETPEDQAIEMIRTALSARAC